MLTETDMSSQPCHPLSLLVITRREVYNISHGERLPASSCQLLRGAADDRMPGLTAQNDRKPYVPKTGVQTPTTAMHSGTKLQHAFRKYKVKRTLMLQQRTVYNSRWIHKVVLVSIF